LAKIATIHYNFPKLLDRILLYGTFSGLPGVVRDNVVSNDVMITSSLRIDVIILGTNFLLS